MSFTSYAQNFEDVMLWRALKNVENGCYVDVGAQDPIIDSVSKAFYEQGWRGIHIEPVPEYAKKLRQDRPDEIVLEVALADKEGTLELNVIGETGLSTAVDAYAQRHLADHGLDSKRVLVPVLTLKSALTSLIDKEVHWLKIDVEGLEGQVLKGWDSKVLRPWVMLVEATIPNSDETAYADWDSILTAAEYQFVYFDGLNRFYIAKEHSELAAALTVPPNVFDDIILTTSSSLCNEVVADAHAREAALLQQAQAQMSQAEAREQALEVRALAEEARALDAQAHVAELEAMLAQTTLRAEQAEAGLKFYSDEYHALINSRSWRMTLPLRLLSSKFGAIVIAIMAYRPQKLGKVVVRRMGNFLQQHPQCKQTALAMLLHVPGLKQRLQQIMQEPAELPDSDRSPLSPVDLSPRATYIYEQLKQAINAGAKQCV